MASLTVGALPMAFQSLTLSSPRLAFPRSQILGVSLSTPSASLCLFSSPPTIPSVIYCGRGDKRTAKGKRFKHSFGNARPRNKKKGRGPPRVPVPPSGPRKDKFDDGEIVKIEIDESLFSS